MTGPQEISGVLHLQGADSKEQTMSKNEPRWYCLSREGMATLCADESDARLTAAGADAMYPKAGPHRAVQLVELAALESAQERQGDSTPAEPRTVEPLTDGELRAALTGLPRGWISDTVRQIALDAERAAAAKWGLVLARGEQG